MTITRSSIKTLLHRIYSGPWYKRIAVWFLTAVLAFILLLVAIDVNFLWLFGRSPGFEEIKHPVQNEASEIYSCDSVLLGRFFSQNRTPVKYEDISPIIIRTLIATEDERFYHHHGVDLKGLFGAAKDIAQGHARGASTITQHKGMLTVYEIEALRRGADDYMPKPFDPTLLVERVKALLKRSSRGTSDTKTDNSKHVYCDGELVIDYDAMQVLVNGISCDLTSNEFKLVQYLEQNAGRVCTRDELLSKVWNYAFSGDVRTVDVTVRRTRKKIEPNQPNYKYILTRRGSGYYFPKEFD